MSWTPDHSIRLLSHLKMQVVLLGRLSVLVLLTFLSQRSSTNEGRQPSPDLLRPFN